MIAWLFALVVIAVLMTLTLEPVLWRGLWRTLSGQEGLIFQRINRSSPERIFGAVWNAQTTTLSAGYSCVLNTAATAGSTQQPGVQVTQPATATLSLFYGVANKDIASSTYGAVQLWGYRSQALVTNDTSQAIAAGDILIPVNAQNYLTRSAASDGKSGYAVAFAAVATATTPAAAQAAVFLRSM